MYHQGQQIRLVGVKVDNLLEKEEKQISLFENITDKKQEKLDKVIDDLKNKYGYNSITRAGKMQLNTKIKFKE